MSVFAETVTPDSPHFVYTFYDADGHELYVGCSGSVGRRIAGHMSTQPWWSQVAHIEATKYPNQRAALDAEREAIEKYEPANNVVHTTRYDAGGWTSRRRRMAEAHDAGYLCQDRACKQCRAEAHAKGVTCPGHYNCPICTNYPAWWSLYSPEKRRTHPDWEPMWEDFLDHEPTYDEATAWFDANDPEWRDRMRPSSRQSNQSAGAA